MAATKSLQGETAFVTGGSSGRAIALRLADDGARVAVADINIQGARESEHLVRAAGGDIRRSRVLWREAAPKTAGSERAVKVVPELHDILRALSPVHADSDLHVFRGRDGHPLHQDRVTQRHWQPALRELQIRPRVLYACRHTFISLALTAGVNLKWLAEYCGTSVVMIERRYGRYMAPPTDQLEHLSATLPSAKENETRDPTPRSRVSRRKDHRKTRVSEGARTLNPWSHSPVLCQLSYTHRPR